MKQTLRDALTNPRSRYFFLVGDALALVTVLSIVVVVLETVPSLQSYQSWFIALEWFAVTVFSLEYLARIWVAKQRMRYVGSFYGVVDVLAIIPSVIGFGNLTFLKTARAVRLIRLLRLVRLAKLTKLQQHQEPDEQLGVIGVNVVLLLLVLLVSVLFVGTLMYVLEPSTTSFQSIPHSMFWAFKVFLIGLPIEYPETLVGQVGHVFARLVGLVIFGVVVGVAGNILRHVLFAEKPTHRT